MRVKVVLQLVAEDGSAGDAEEVVTFEKTTERPEDIGLSIADTKLLLGAVQQRIVAAQAAAWSERHRCCLVCGRRRRSKGYYPIVFRTLFGDVQLASPRLHRCACEAGNHPGTFAPLIDLLPDHVAPERLYLEARWASLVPYAAVSELLSDVLPVGAGICPSTLRAHTLRVAEHAEAALRDERPCFIEGCPAQWRGLPIPEGRIVVGIDGGYVRSWTEKKTNFEVIVACSIPEDRPTRYIGLVHGYDAKPKRRLVDMLTSQGLQPNQDITFLTDGAEEVRALTELISPCSEHVLDWFHITMRLTVLNQYAKGVAQLDPTTGARLEADIERIKWLLWHGNLYRAVPAVNELQDDVDALEIDYEYSGKFARAAHEFATYIANNTDSIINYGERFRAGERISSGFVESAVNAIISKRFAKKQQMQWTPRGAHLLLQVRTRTLDGTLRSLFQSWYPGLANDNQSEVCQAAAA
jgi:hypothetical protein